MWAVRVISNYRMFIPTTQKELICTQQAGPKIMKLIRSIKDMELPKKGRNVIIHIQKPPYFPPRSLSLYVCLTIVFPRPLSLFVAFT